MFKDELMENCEYFSFQFFNLKIIFSDETLDINCTARKNFRKTKTLTNFVKRIHPLNILYFKFSICKCVHARAFVFAFFNLC